MNYKTINTVDESKKNLEDNDGVLFFFSTTKCSLGEALEPKVDALIQSNYPKISFYFVDMMQFPMLAAHYGVFVEPTILIFFDGKESIRKSRNIGIEELSLAISRLYKIIFD
ncbi:MAG: thioredoxin family protein [Flavobacteriaceae bacterium]|nr:thioredoxin family protein [Flavobacteriaceae bacterium]